MLDHSGPLAVTVVIPVKNEVHSIGKTLAAIFAQTRQPNEIMITDGGSTDGTIELIHKIQEEHPELKLLCLPQAYPGHGRNHSIRHATGQVIACVDAGCFPEPAWLAELVQPFQEGAEVVLGHVTINQHSTFQEAVARLFFPQPGEVDLAAPPWIGGNLAFTQQVWQAIGGFPEDQRAAEDFVYWQKIRQQGFRVVYAPTAVITWDQPSDLRSFFAQQNRYMRWMTRIGYIAQEPAVELLLLIATIVASIVIHPILLTMLIIAPILYVLLRMIKARQRLQNWLTPQRTGWVAILLIAKPSARMIGLVKGLIDRSKKR